MARTEGLRSSQNQHQLSVPFTVNQTFADRAFSTNVPKLWNSLPTNKKSSQNIEMFKKNLKTHLFYEYFNSDYRNWYQN